MNDDQQEKLNEVRVKREGTIGRINALLGELKIERPPGFTPFTAAQTVEVSSELHRAALELLAASKDDPHRTIDDDDRLKGAVECYENVRDGLLVDFDAESTPVAVVSLAGLERIESLLSEMVQLREGKG
jgi:hypothetical protein